MFIVMQEVTREDKSTISSKQIHHKVNQAFIRQKNRGQYELNGKLNDKDILKYCILDNKAQEILDTAIENYSLSFRAVNKVLKVARTIADLEDNTFIQKTNLLESLSYRKR
jgi:magnesium chelatase family protein